MPTKKNGPTRYCGYEGAQVPADEFRTIDGSVIHQPEGLPPHRPDGLTVSIENGKVTVVANDSMSAVADAFRAEEL